MDFCYIFIDFFVVDFFDFFFGLFDFLLSFLGFYFSKVTKVTTKL